MHYGIKGNGFKSFDVHFSIVKVLNLDKIYVILLWLVIMENVVLLQLFLSQLYRIIFTLHFIKLDWLQTTGQLLSALNYLKEDDF